MGGKDNEDDAMLHRTMKPILLERVKRPNTVRVFPRGRGLPWEITTVDVSFGMRPWIIAALNIDDGAVLAAMEIARPYPPEEMLCFVGLVGASHLAEEVILRINGSEGEIRVTRDGKKHSIAHALHMGSVYRISLHDADGWELGSADVQFGEGGKK